MKKILLLSAVLMLSACSKLTSENYDKLKMGMSAEEVKTILGEPDNCSEALGTKSCIWGNEEATYIKVSFVADNAATFSNNGLK
ncbi:DUF3862 domain-containing protein [Thalassomonas viridans]|uniref:DUF3862 domain-containing protein n=1 Tax=Thalassomonas viridans TaxID=137584 RepID=A0AAE9Z259_9GAMM|nr:DUF3862 domain-containing protein [Thalassomonas viridans]WDE04867.1 DUF3862 domain-containing protein [Thalassomonas viridans]